MDVDHVKWSEKGLSSFLITRPFPFFPHVPSHLVAAGPLLLQRLKEHAHELLHVVLLEGLGPVPPKRLGQVRGLHRARRARLEVGVQTGGG